MNTNFNFPLIKYQKDQNHYQWGFGHGKEYETGIKELIEIRKDLMLKKNPKLLSKLDELAMEQFEITKKVAPHLSEELRGIADGANTTLTNIIILNNYTDFRDIQLPDEGCSTIHLQTQTEVLSGQTWDMHRSAKNYLCLIDVPRHNINGRTVAHSVILSLVGCVGLMGVNTHNCLIGVNNINTGNARSGIIWPVLVRRTLEGTTLEEMREILKKLPVTSGHNYLISSKEGGEHWEITPDIAECVGKVEANTTGFAFHTNHCLGSEIQKLEDKGSMSSTTFNRYDLLTKKVIHVKNINTLKGLLTDHEEFPKSICSHFENGAQDPSFTCGGGVADLKKNVAVFWRGCPLHDHDYVEYHVAHNNEEFNIKKTT